MDVRTFLLVLLLSVSAVAEPSHREVELRVIELTNEVRARYGLSQVKEVPDLSEVAREHSREQIELDYSGHYSPVPERRHPLDRVRLAKVPASGIGENVMAKGGNAILADPAAEAVYGFLRSPSHRATLLHPGYTGIGVGVAGDPEGEYRITQMLCLEHGPGVTPEKPIPLDPAPAPSTAPLTEAEKKEARELADQRINNGTSFPGELTSDHRKARLFLHLAKTSTDPTLLAASLDALSTIFSANPGAPATMNGEGYARILITDEFRELTLKHLESEKVGVLYAALACARNLVWGPEPDPAAIEKVSRLALEHPNPDVRETAVFELGFCSVASPLRDRAVLAALRSDDPRAAVESIDYQGHPFASEEAQRETFALVWEHLVSPDQDLRMKALEACVGSCPDERKPLLCGALTLILRHSDRRERRHALLLAGYLKRPELLPALVALPSKDMELADQALQVVNDLEPGFNYELRGQREPFTPEQKAILKEEALRVREWWSRR